MENPSDGPGDKKKQVLNTTTERDRNEPASAERTNEKAPAETAPDAGSPSREEVISKTVHPVTNQDEQDKITNAGSNDIPVADK